jgi:serine/threonine protein kinase/regulator of sirC expression with transglutaminase-like and TPR domain
MLEKTLQGRYSIIKPLGSGGFSSTFLGIDQQQPECPKCVIKQLEPQLSDPVNLQLARRLFKTEAKVLQKLGNHPQIPQLFDYFEENQEFYLVQEYIQGHDLSEELTAGKQWSESDVICLLQDILETLAFVHQQNVIHRDIKPSNLIRRHSDYKIVLIDFGAVKQIGTQTVSASGMPPLTIAIGTPGYFPTEQASGMPKFSSDIYAVGMIGISALTGLSPTRHEFPKDPDTNEISWNHLAQVTQELVNIIDKMVRYDFRDRYQSIEAVLSDLKNLQTSTQITVPLNAQELSASSEATISWSQPENSTSSQVPTTAVVNAQELLASPEATTSWSQPEDSTSSQVPNVPMEPTKVAVRRRPFKPAVLLLAGGGTVLGFSWLLMSSNILSKSPLSPSASIIRPTETSQNSQALDLLNKANQLKESQKSEEALTVYEQVLQLDPKLKSARWGQCYALNVLKRYAEALKSCEQALSLDPNYPEALNSKGYAFNALKRYQEALNVYEQALKIKPDYFEALVNKGATLYNMQQYDKALEAYDKVLKIKPDYPEAWNNKGTALAASKNYQAALEAYDKAVQFKQDYPEAWNNRGVALEKMQRNQEALSSYEKAIQLQPNYLIAEENHQRLLKTLKP